MCRRAGASCRMGDGATKQFDSTLSMDGILRAGHRECAPVHARKAYAGDEIWMLSGPPNGDRVSERRRGIRPTE
jgi:hypothetical protein